MLVCGRHCFLFPNLGKNESKNAHTCTMKLHTVVMRSKTLVSKLRFVVLEQRCKSIWCSHGIDAELDHKFTNTWR